MSKNPVVRFYELLLELLEKPTFDTNLARNCRAHYLIHSNRLSLNTEIVESAGDGDEPVCTQDFALAIKELHTRIHHDTEPGVRTIVLGLAQSAFVDMSHFIVSSVDAQTTFRRLVTLARLKNGDLFVHIVKTRTNDGFASVTLITDSHQALMGRIGTTNEDEPGPNEKAVHISGGDIDVINSNLPDPVKI